MAEAPQFRVDPLTGEVQEAVFQAAPHPDSFQGAIDAAQAAVNAATDAVSASEVAYTDAVAAVEASSLALEDARKGLEAANVDLQFQTDRKAALDEALRLRDELAIASPENEFSEPVADSEDPGTGESVEYSVPVTVA